MAITNYTELKSSVSGWLNRDDLTTQIPDFIRLAESFISDELRHWRGEKRAETTLDGQFIGLPSDWVETIRIHTNAGGTGDMRYLSRAQMQSMRAANEDASGAPEFYTHNAGQLELYPTPDGNYSADLAYYADAGALSDSNTTNWVLTKYPDIYLYGTLLQAGMYLMDTEMEQRWAALYRAAVDRANRNSRKSVASGSGLKMTIRGY